MLLRNLICCLLVVGFVGCQTPYKKTDKEEAVKKKDQSGDTSFKGFVGRLQIAVAKKDLPTIASMMTADFGYRLDTPPEGENVFTYWDQKGLWPVMRGILREKFVPNETYMVAPPQVVADPNYGGYRAGLRMVNGSWKFAYFVSVE